MSTAKDEREKALEAAMAQIQKQFGKGAIMKLGEGAAQQVQSVWIWLQVLAAYQRGGS